MIVRENISLASLTTLRVGGTARYVLECAGVEDLKEAAAFIRDRSLSYMFLGQGSNICAADEGYDGVCISLKSDSVTFTDDLVCADAGVSWDFLVTEACERGLWGIENLAAIPGTVGASPVQNIGAYGMDVSQTIEWVEVLNMRTLETQRLSTMECEFAYRDSIFKRRPELAITQVAFRLSQQGTPHTAYKDLQALNEELSTPAVVADAVRRIRSVKFPDLTVCGTAGSFFKNPIISEQEYAELIKVFPEIPTYADAKGIKVPLAWILDHVLHLNGFTLGPVHLFKRQPLVLVTDAGATAADVDAMATEVAARVHAATHISIEREVRSLSKTKI